MADNKIGDKGARTMCEILQANTFLISLDLSCDEGYHERRKRKRKRIMIE